MEAKEQELDEERIENPSTEESIQYQQNNEDFIEEQQNKIEETEEHQSESSKGNEENDEIKINERQAQPNENEENIQKVKEEKNNNNEEEKEENKKEGNNENLNSKDLAWKKVLRHVEKRGIRGFTVVGKRTGAYAAQIDGITNMVTIRVKRNMFLLKIRFPIEVPSARREAMAELLARINYNMLLGSFQIDMSDGELFYFHANTIGDKLNESIITKNIAVSQMTVHQHAQTFSKLIYSEKTPLELLQQDPRPPSSQTNLMQALLSALGPSDENR